MTTTKTKAVFNTFIYGHPVNMKVGVERFIVTKEIDGKTIETSSQVNVSKNNNEQKLSEGWLGSWTEGSTTIDRYFHGPRTIVKIEPKYGWNHELDRSEETPYGYEITWN